MWASYIYNTCYFPRLKFLSSFAHSHTFYISFSCNVLRKPLKYLNIFVQVEVSQLWMQQMKWVIKCCTLRKIIRCLLADFLFSIERWIHNRVIEYWFDISSWIIFLFDRNIGLWIKIDDQKLVYHWVSASSNSVYV